MKKINFLGVMSLAMLSGANLFAALEDECIKKVDGMRLSQVLVEEGKMFPVGTDLNMEMLGPGGPTIVFVKIQGESRKYQLVDKLSAEQRSSYANETHRIEWTVSAKTQCEGFIKRGLSAGMKEFEFGDLDWDHRLVLAS